MLELEKEIEVGEQEGECSAPRIYSLRQGERLHHEPHSDEDLHGDESLVVVVIQTVRVSSDDEGERQGCGEPFSTMCQNTVTLQPPPRACRDSHND